MGARRQNLSGGVLHGRVIDDVFSGFARRTPVERQITRQVTTFLTSDCAVGLDHASDTLREPVNAVTVLRATFDPRLAGNAQEAGVVVMPGCGSTGSWLRPARTASARLSGVPAGEDRLRALVVVAADGVSSFLVCGAGLRDKAPASHMAVGVKAVVTLPRGVIEDQSRRTGDQGAAHATGRRPTG